MNSTGLMVVTGGAGFIGSHLVEALLREGYFVRVVDNLAAGRLENLAAVEGRFEWLEGDVAELEVCREATRDADCVFHLAAIPSVPRSILDPIPSYASGPTATFQMLEAARLSGVRRFIFAASSSAYGDTESLPKREDMLPRPLSPYAAGKLAGEAYVHAYAQSMGLDGASLRYFNIFGPRQDPSSPYSGVISRFTTMMTKGERPVIHGDGLQTRDFTYVANAVAANLAALRSPTPLKGVVLNVGTGRRISLLEVVATLNGHLGTSLEPHFEPPRVGDVRDSQACLERINDTLGYQPTVDFEDGLKRTLDLSATMA